MQAVQVFTCDFAVAVLQRDDGLEFLGPDMPTGEPDHHVLNPDIRDVGSLDDGFSDGGGGLLDVYNFTPFQASARGLADAQHIDFAVLADFADHCGDFGGPYVQSYNNLGFDGLLLSHMFIQDSIRVQDDRWVE
jgi:hypothetical protein